MRRSLQQFIRMRHVLALSLCCCITMAAEGRGAANHRLGVGTPLTEALQHLRREGLRIVYSSQLITPGMKVTVAIASKRPRAQLDELLASHDLAALDGPGGVLIVVAKPAGNSRPQPDSQPPPPPSLTVEDEIFVEPDHLSLAGDDPPPPFTLGQKEIQEHARLADDVFRTLEVLPGISSGDVSAELHIRGARRDEMLVLLDGQELYEPYHLRDFDNPLSIVDASALERVSLLTGAFPVNYGDRVAGVLDMSTSPASSSREVTISASLLGVQFDASDTHRNGRLGWMTSGRRGSTDLIGQTFDFEDPRFWDLFGKFNYEITANQSARGNLLMSRDSFHYVDAEEIRRIDTDYDSYYLWFSHQASLSSRLYAHTSVSSSFLKQARAGLEEDQIRAFEVDDDRRLEVSAIRQSWGFQADARNFVNFGLEYQKFDAVYDYSSFGEFFIGGAVESGGSFVLDERFRSEKTTVYASDRFRALDDLTIELGLRYDAQTSRDGSMLSPRISVAWALRPSDVLRLAWGKYSQSHRPYELMIEDGDATFYPAEQSEHWGLGYERSFSSAMRLPLQSVKVDGYLRHSENPRPRYENLFESFHPFPEGEPFRLRVEPESATARGLELLVRGRPTARWNWWLNYALADTNDRINGREVPRRVDQTHSINADLTFRPSRKWSVNLAWLYHTGWPITSVSLVDSGGERVPLIGPLNGSRLKNYNRIDLRLSRDFLTRAGTLTLFLDAQNVMNNRNEAGIELRIGDESGELEIRRERWPGFLASAGFVWRLDTVRGD